MAKLALTLLTATAAGILTPVLLSAGGGNAPQRQHKGEPIESVAKAYPLLARTMPNSKQGKLLTPRRSLTSPLQRPEIMKARGAAPVKMIGNVVYADNWDSRYSAYGLYEISAGQDVATDLKLKGTNSAPNSNGGAVLVDDKFYSTNWYEMWGFINIDLTVYDVNTWTKIDTYFIDESIDYIATEMAYDPNSETIYGCFYNASGTGYELATIEYVDGGYDDYYDRIDIIPVRNRIGSLSGMVVALGVTSDGRLYGVQEDGCLYQYNTQNASATLIGDTGLKIASSAGIRPQSGSIDRHNDKFYWASVDMNGNSVMYTVDLNDAHLEEISALPNQERIYGLTCLPHAAADAAPNYLTDFSVFFEGANLNGTVSFNLPEDNYDGSDPEATLTWHILVNGEEMATGSDAPGAAITKDITVEGGQTLFEVYAENSVGASPYSSIDLWIGEDIPVMKRADFDYVNNIATVSWAIEPTGQHNGVVSDPLFNVVRMPGGVLVAESTPETSFTETLTSEMPLGSYYYVITPANHGFEGEPMETGKHIIGQSIIPPYIQTFDTPESLDLFTIIGKEWSWSTRGTYSENGVVDCRKSNYNDEPDEAPMKAAGASSIRSNSWLITPEIKVEAGNTYEIRLKSWAVYGDKFEIWYGEGLDPSAYSILMPATPGFLDPDFTSEHVVSLTATQTGSIHLGFVHAGEYDSFLRIDDLTISAGTSQASPATIADLQVIPAAKGGLSATIKFTAPSNDQQGNSIDHLDRIDILLDTEVVRSFENPVPGNEYQFVYQASDNGFYNFRAEAYNENGRSEAAEVRSFIGVDVPKAPAAQILDKGNYIQVKWVADATGVNGQYINPEGLYYALFMMDDSGFVDDEPIAEGIQGDTYSINFDPRVGPQGLLQFLTVAYNVAGVSDFRYTSPLLVGEPLSLPFSEGFDPEHMKPWIPYTNSDLFDLSTSHSSDGDGYSFGWGILQDEPEASLESGKIATDGNDKLLVNFDYICNEGNTIDLYVVYPDGTSQLCGTADEESTGSNDDWKRANMEITGLEGLDYCRLRFVFHNNAGYYHFMHLDNVNVDAAIDHDLKVTASFMKGQAEVGRTAVIEAHAINSGLENIEGATVSLYVNDVLAETKNVKTLASHERDILHFNYLIKPSDAGEIEFRILGDYAPDMRQDNNEVFLFLNVAEPTAPAPQNLTGEESGNGVNLTWEAPEEFQVETVVEDFESYEPFSIDELGEWTLVDADGRKTLGLSGLIFANNGSPMAYMVFNPSLVVLPDETVGLPAGNTEALPYDGDQYLAAFATKLDDPNDHNDDWLISPPLSGNTQTISFFAKQMISYYGPETIQVLYSATTKDTDAFELLETIDIDNPDYWTEYSVNLPEGAKYFAIRVITARGHMFMLDHVTYEKGTSRIVTGYNIYRDNNKIANVGHDVLTFNDPETNASHTYNVTALFASGHESGFSNSYSSGSGIGVIEADKTYSIITVEGIVLERQGRDLKDLPKGIYLINGRKTVIK